MKIEKARENKDKLKSVRKERRRERVELEGRTRVDKRAVLSKERR